MNKIIKTITLCWLILCVSCEISRFDDSFQQTPNLLTPDQADPNFLLNNVQKEVGDLMQSLNRTTDEVMRYTYLNESYVDVANPTVLNGEFREYHFVLEDAKIIESAATDDTNFLFHRGMSTILNTYATVTMVDYLGDIPFSESNRREDDIFNPKPDDGAEIYETLLSTLDTAIEDVTNATVTPVNDLFYDGDATKMGEISKIITA